MFAQHNLLLSVNAADDDYESPLSVPESRVRKVTWFLMLPATLLYFVTIPDCRRGGVWTKLFPLTFIMSIVWLGGLSYVMV